MKFRLSVVVLYAVSSVLLVEIAYLKVLPGSFVRIYYTSDPKEFNKTPTEIMTIEIDGHIFDYRIPHSMREDILKEVNDLIRNDSINTFDSLIIIANWVRSKLKFGVPDYDSDDILIEDILSDTKNADLSVLCDSYARLFVIACQSQDIPARILELEGHVVTEAFIWEISKWIMIDPIYGYYISKDSVPLSAIEIINYYKKGVILTPVVFAEGKGDDCLYEERHEGILREIYMNGFTVVTDQTLDRKKIKDTILRAFQLPIAKIQFIDTNSTLIGYKEKVLRYAILLTIGVFIVISIVAAKRT